jgi:glycosyltransferase involved in cell wall biosynthesis
MAPPTISVVVPAYDASATLGSTLASILDQTHRELEVLVVDDGSTDDTAAIIERAADHDPRVVPVAYGGNRGRSFARNEGMRRATGDWVAMVDADDLLARDRFERVMGAVATFPDTRLLTDDRLGWRLDARGGVVVEHRFPGRHTWRVGEPHRLDPVRHFIDRFGHLDVVVRRDFLESTGATYPEDMSTAEDLTFYNTLLFWPDDPRPVRVARGSYYYRLAPTSRTAGGREARVLMARRVAAATHNPSFDRAVARSASTHAFLSGRAERQLAAEGRLRERPAALDGIDTPAENRVTGTAALVGIKALQWLGRQQDRRDRPAIAADIARQLARSV